MASWPEEGIFEEEPQAEEHFEFLHDMSSSFLDASSVTLDDDAVIAPSLPKKQCVNSLGSRPEVSCSASAFDAWLRSQRNQRPKHFWEQPHFKSATGDFSGWNSQWNLKGPSIGMTETISQSSDAGAPEPHYQHASMAAQRLRLASLIKTDDQVRWEALRKLKMILLTVPSATRLGKLLISGANRLCGEAELSTSFCDAFSGKSTATLAKRSSSLWRFAQWLEANNLPPLVSASERHVYQYMEHLKIHGYPTTARSFLEALSFLHHVVGLTESSLNSIVSTRVKGAANNMLARKEPLKQSQPLKVKMVVALENIVEKGPYLHWQLIAGHFLFCLGSCCRFADSIHLDSIVVSEANGLQLLEASSKIFKTGTTEEKRKRLLPLISCGSFFARQPWARNWMVLRMGAGFLNDPSLPAFSEVTGRFLDRKMSTGEAVLFLREMLLGSGFPIEEVMQIGCHSLKTTLLAWSAMYGKMSLSDRRLLGHHLDPGSVSAVTYARDELTRLQVEVQMMLRAIRHKHFSPDESRVERVLRALPANSDSEAGSEDVCDHDLQRANPLDSAKPRVGDIDPELADCRVHRFSGVCHYMSDAFKFFCGRKVTRNYEILEAELDIQEMPFCTQCSTAFKVLKGI